MIKTKTMVGIVIVLQSINFLLSDIPVKEFIDKSIETKEEKEWKEIVKNEYEEKDKEKEKRIFESIKDNKKESEKELKKLNSIQIHSNTNELLKDDKAYEQCLYDDGNYCEE